MSVLVALCVDTTATPDIKDLPADLVSVRKFVLEATSRALKDLPPSDNPETRYSRLLALADLCHRLLTVRFNSSGKKTDEVPTHVAKVMLEKNFVAKPTVPVREFANRTTIVGYFTTWLHSLIVLALIYYGREFCLFFSSFTSCLVIC